ncbi:alpha-D-xyloside xylohydrolase [Chitinophaga niastensis]|uniref:Alpha-D-xyloside xylohydrolase n=1 Tax=Chitinophaga niastensis TaxID=536980 RepID=A0A2P8HJ24_CHINA|nr:TIM-barrel domain-containing protein [Chitinophaga niastensis]PSL46180.1 alpha-D-xyloside xylohydrolase [Chitinophaga niastensis]
MQTKRTISLVLFTLLTSWCYAGQVDKLADGLLIHLKQPAHNGARQVKLQVISDKVIHVSATAGDNFNGSPSLMAVDVHCNAVKWDSEENNETVVLKTNSLTASVALNTGEVVFSDKDGHILLQEQRGGGKTFAPVIIDNKQLYRIQQVFESPANEAFYGLGQHQTGLMNYKNQDVDLTQYNSVAAVPFVVSNRHYGILWDNYSITRFGDDRAYDQLSALHLTTTDGKSGGLTAVYADRYNNTVYLQSVEDKIDYGFLNLLGNLPAAFPMVKGKVTWEGTVNADENGEYKFFMSTSGYTKVWIDGQLKLDKWRESWNPGASVFHHPLKKGQPATIKVEWIPETAQSFISLKFLSPTPAALQNKMALTSEAGEKIDYYFMYGNNMDEVISGYRQVTGKATMIPRWALGFWQSRERYKTQDEIENTVATFREKKIPLDNIVLDWSYWKQDEWGSQQFDPSRFPNPAAMIETLHKKYNAHFMISVWPKFYEGIDNYKLFDNKNWLYKQNIKNKQHDWIGNGYVSTFYDAFNPEARKLFWNLINKNLFSKGVDAWWLDATEPDILSNASIEDRKTLMNPTALGSSTQYFNTYALVNAKGIYEGQRATSPDQRVFILTRSAYAGLQRYAAATWSGDVAATFEELSRQIPAGLNFCMSGLPYWTTDIGGFFVEDKYDKPNPQGAAQEEWRELNTRWFQYGAFCPLFRSHGQFPYREMFNIAPDSSVAYQSMLYYDKLRYRLLPYIYSLAGSTYHHDYTIMRALPMDYDKDTTVLNIRDQFMFGPALLVNPVTQYQARSRALYLPAGNGWYDFYTGKYLAGGQYINAAAPLSRMPLYVKEGAILPVGPALQYTDERKADTIQLYVYTGKDGEFTLYEDENTNYQYEKGVFSNITFRWNEAVQTLTIGRREGNFPGMLKQRYFRIIYIGKNKPVTPDVVTPAGEMTTYNGIAKTVRAF